MVKVNIYKYYKLINIVNIEDLSLNRFTGPEKSYRCIYNY